MLRINDSDGKFSNNPDGGVQYALYVGRDQVKVMKPHDIVASNEGGQSSSWNVIFRGMSGANYNRNLPLQSTGDFAVSLANSHRQISFLRLTNNRTKNSVVIKCDAELQDLATEFEIAEGWIWNGRAKYLKDNQHGRPRQEHLDMWQLGLASKEWPRHDYKGGATIAGKKFGYGGFGFARLNHKNNHGGTQYMWANVIQAEPFELEISVSSESKISAEDGVVLNDKTVSVEKSIDIFLPSALHSNPVEVTIEGSSSGQPIGDFQIGQEISIRYLRGQWGFGGTMGTNMVSPDAKQTNPAAYAILVEPDGRTNLIPTGTQAKPYGFIVKQDGIHLLRMADLHRDDNRGEVVYAITTTDLSSKDLEQSALNTEVLFDGTSLEKWRGYKTEKVISKWRIEDGLLRYTGSDWGDICTKKEYEDFDLSFQWKVGASGNSGIMYRVQRGPEKSFFSGPEYQIIDNKSYSDDPKQHSGAIYDLYANHLDNASAVGAWNVSRIVHRGSKVQHWLNGKLAVTADIGSNDWNSRVAGTNLAKHPSFSKNPRGHIVVQGHKNNNVWFKNIVIKDLSQRHSAKTGEPPADPPIDNTVEFQGKQYLLFPEIVTWEQARLRCEQMGGTLACPASVKENEFLFGLGKKNNRIDALWLGATDQQKEGKWVTSSGKRLAFNQWGPHQPNNKRSKEHFALLILRYSKDRRLAGTWSDQPLVSDAHRPGFVCVWENRPEVKKASGGSTLQKQDLDVGRGAKEKTLDMDSIPDVDGNGWVRLFNGKNLKGWTRRQGTANFRVFNGAIIGETSTTRANSYLCTNNEFGDFELTFEANIKGGNSGVQIRSLSKPNYKEGKVHGPQIDIEMSPGENGYIYGEATGRQWISKNKPIQNAFVNGQWNRFVIRAQGYRIQTWVNGQPIEDLVDSNLSQTGFIGLQVHSMRGQTGPFQMGWRDIRIREK